MTDLEDLAENKLEALEAEEVENKEEEDKGEEDELQEANESEESNGKEDQEGQDEEDESEESDDDEESEEPEDGAKELTDDELIELAKKRGLDLAPKEEPKKPEPTAEYKRPKELDEDTWSGMNQVQQAIYSSLPYITVRGKNADGELYQLNIKTPEQLPEDFEFVNKREEASFISDVTAQSKRAEEYYARIAGKLDQDKQAETQQEQSRRVVADVDRLQKEGIIPKIKAKPNTPEFNDDPSVKLVNEVLNYWQKLNEAGENVSVYTATKLFKADNPDKFRDTTKSSGDDERKKVASKVKGTGKGGKGEKPSGPKFPVGTSASDIADYYMDQLD